MKTPDQRQWLTPKEVAEIFRVCPKTVTRWAQDQGLPSIKTPGGHRRFRRDVIERLLCDWEEGDSVAGGDESLPVRD